MAVPRRRRSDENPSGASGGRGERIDHDPVDSESEFETVLSGRSPRTGKLLDEETSFPSVSKLRQQCLKDSFSDSCFKERYHDPPPPALSKEYEIGKYLDSESFLCAEPVVKNLNVLDLLGNDNLLSFNSTAQGIENVTLNLKGKYLMICCVFVPSIWCSGDGPMVYHLALASHELARRDDFALVVVPMMRKGFAHSYSAYRHFLSGFSCLAVSFHDSHRRALICSALGFDGKMKVVILDPSQNVLYHGPPEMFRWFGGAENAHFPFTPERAKICLCCDKVLDGRSLNELLGLSDTDVLYNIAYLSGQRLEEDGRSITISELKQKPVGLYMCSNGERILMLQKIYQECKGKECELQIVVVCCPFPWQVPPKLHEEVVIDALASLKLLGLWFSPFNNTTSHRLRRMREAYEGRDGLFIVDPIEKCVDPYGLEIFCDFGMDCYPFTRRKLIDNELQRKMGLRLNSLLPWEHARRDTVEIPVAEVLKNKIVLLYIYDHPGVFIGHHLVPWYKKNIKGKHSNVEVVIVDVYGYNQEYYERWFNEQGWLVCPADPSKSDKLRAAFFHSDRVFHGNDTKDVLVAFDEDGRIRSVNARQILASHGPPFHGNIYAEIGQEFYFAGFCYMRQFDSL